MCYRNKVPLNSAALATVVLLSLSSIAAAQPAYNVINLSQLFGNYSLSATAINDAGQVLLTGGAGASYLYSNGTLTQIGSAADVTRVNDLNNQGQIVGYARPDENGSEFQAFLFNPNTSTTINPAPPGSVYSYGYAINNLGQVVGQSQSPASPPSVFLYDGSESNVINALAGLDPVPMAINDSGEILVNDIGTASVYLNGTVTNIGSFGASTNAYAMNNAGAVVGSSAYTNNLMHAFLFDGTQMIDIDPTDTQNSVAEAINSHGQVVGDLDVNTVPVAFLYQNGILTTLSSLLPLEPDGEPDNIYGNLLINNSGEIVCTGGTNVLLLIPVVPAPAATSVLAGMLMLKTFHARRRRSATVSRHETMLAV